ncbi:hypothetical protein HYQ46_001019 [Verticillium longisporum]|nr:hypothetical protein HYQ46_001019 [Verticillium longisporum]
MTRDGHLQIGRANFFRFIGVDEILLFAAQFLVLGSCGLGVQCQRCLDNAHGCLVYAESVESLAFPVESVIDKVLVDRRVHERLQNMRKSIQPSTNTSCLALIAESVILKLASKQEPKQLFAGVGHATERLVDGEKQQTDLVLEVAFLEGAPFCGLDRVNYLDSPANAPVESIEIISVQTVLDLLSKAVVPFTACKSVS